jgi:L-alanine-DL-glutamate epimerase-like enolase superfamily enzyme
LKITRIETFVVKIPRHDRFGGQADSPQTFAGSDYYFESDWREVYSRKTESLLIRVSTDEGIHGWGESQSPIVPEAAGTIIDRLLGPMALGHDPRDTSALWDRMYGSMNVRGQLSGFMLDAINGLDIAFWDIKGKAADKPVAELLGGPLWRKFPAYVSGIRATTDPARAVLAAEHFADGFAGVKLYLGRGVSQDIAQAHAVRKHVGDDKRLMADLFWKYTLAQAEELGRALGDMGIEWIESPLPPEEIRDHAKLAASLDIPVAVGEPLRTRFQFLDWFERRALDIAQPDIVRCGITEGRRITELAAARNIPVAFHLGVCLGIGIAATWQLAAATPGYMILEHQPPMIELSNQFLTEPLRFDHGQAVLPEKPGLGIDVNLDALGRWVGKR